ncbi:hypothetical protein HGRIS_012153 [Hohenbuehelia grisea]|uniref:Uncharacterized protein n=1 Tax=Hohenbuehelia grisea TaxID=104357 RepID=A0ABR3IRI2_9AGAR
MPLQFLGNARVLDFVRKVKRALKLLFGGSSDAFNIQSHPGGVLVTYQGFLFPPDTPPSSPITASATQMVVTSAAATEYLEELVVDEKSQSEVIMYPSSLDVIDETSSPISTLTEDTAIRIFEFVLGSIPDGRDRRTTPLSELGVVGTNPRNWKGFVSLGGTNRIWRAIRHEYFRMVPFPDQESFMMVGGLLKSMGQEKPIVMVDPWVSSPCRHWGIPLAQRPQDLMERYFKNIKVLYVERAMEVLAFDVSAMFPVPLDGYFGHPAPILESFALTGPTYSYGHRITRQLFQNDAPALRDMTLTRCWLAASSSLLMKLTSLTLNGIQDPRGIRTMLRAANQLVSLDLVFSLPLEHSWRDESPLELPNLQHLRIVDQDALEPVLLFFEWLRAPADLSIGISWHWVQIKDHRADLVRAELKDTLKWWRANMKSDNKDLKKDRTTVEVHVI